MVGRLELVVVTLALGVLAAPLVAEAQPAGKVYRIGHIAPLDFDRPERLEQRSWPAFIEGLSSLGWINMKTAKALGLTIPPLLLFRADKVIE